VEQDRGDIEDLVHGVEVIEEQGNQVEDEDLPEFIIDEGDGSPKADEQMNPIQAAKQDVEVNIFIPNIQIMPDEIQENDLIKDQLLDIDNDNDVHTEVDAEVHEELQLGFVQLIEPSMDPDLVSRLSPFRNNADAVRL
jgi:hypothetical protein